MKKTDDYLAWKILRDEKKYLTSYELWETDDNRTAFYLYQIGEWGMMKFCMRFQIVKNKFDPKLVFDSNSRIFNYVFDELKFSDWGFQQNKYLVLWEILEQGYKGRIIVLDVDDLQFSIISDKYGTVEINDDAVTLTIKTFDDHGIQTEPVNSIIEIDKIDWKPISKFS